MRLPVRFAELALRVASHAHRDAGARSSLLVHHPAASQESGAAAQLRTIQSQQGDSAAARRRHPVDGRLWQALHVTTAPFCME